MARPAAPRALSTQQRVADLRRDQTDAERQLWQALRSDQLGVRFVRQFEVGGAIVDFACRRARLAIELDGGQHSENAHDAVRTARLQEMGWRVLRFWNTEVFESFDGVLIAIDQALTASGVARGPMGVRDRSRKPSQS